LKNSSPFAGFATVRYFWKSFCLITLTAFSDARCITSHTADAVLSISGVRALYSKTASSVALEISAWPGFEVYQKKEEELKLERKFQKFNIIQENHVAEVTYPVQEGDEDINCQGIPGWPALLDLFTRSILARC
jgi:hypothetical protein